MSGPRDDMVFAPTLGKSKQATAPVRAREARRLAREKRKGGLLPRIAKYRAAQRLKASRRATSGAKRVAAARGARPSSFAGVRTASAPLGAAIAGLLVAGFASLRLLTGQPLEETGEQVNRILLGDLDDEARAKLATRRQLVGDSDIVRIVGREKGVNSQIASVAKDLKELNLRKEIGASKLREEFPIDGTFGILVNRGAEKLKDAFRNNGGPDNVERLRVNYQKIREDARGR